MGTNFYIRYNKCSCCDRYDELHVGKSSYGWSFSFHSLDEYVDISKLDLKHLLVGTEEICLKIKR